jgi:hypothetical protein
MENIKKILNSYPKHATKDEILQLIEKDAIFKLFPEMGDKQDVIDYVVKSY